VIVKTFTAPNFEQALWLLNEDLGPNAVILKTRFNNAKNISGKPLQFVEITAFLDSALYTRECNEHCQSEISKKSSCQYIQSGISDGIIAGYGTAVDVEILEVVGW
jgi:flagellar biosynthesis GTPase FlhF